MHLLFVRVNLGLIGVLLYQRTPQNVLLVLGEGDDDVLHFWGILLVLLYHLVSLVNQTKGISNGQTLFLSLQQSR
jgi:hypothetical protein